MALQEAQCAPLAACHSNVHFTLKKHVNVCDFCCTRAIKERSTSETCSEAVLRVPIIFYNVEELIKEQAKRMLFVTTRSWSGKRGALQAAAGVLSWLGAGGVSAAPCGVYHPAGVWAARGESYCDVDPSQQPTLGAGW